MLAAKTTSMGQLFIHFNLVKMFSEFGHRPDARPFATPHTIDERNGLNLRHFATLLTYIKVNYVSSLGGVC